jgi:hypothetical protein
MRFRILTERDYRQLLANRGTMEKGEHDFVPVVKLFTPDAQCTWLLTDIDETGMAFGLCDLGHGEPELGYVDMNEVIQIRGKLGLPVERDRSFEGDKPISAYAKEAMEKGRIVA